jgi:hypothetical protein
VGGASATIPALTAAAKSAPRRQRGNWYGGGVSGGGIAALGGGVAIDAPGGGGALRGGIAAFGGGVALEIPGGGGASRGGMAALGGGVATRGAAWFVLWRIDDANAAGTGMRWPAAYMHWKYTRS